MPVNSRAKGAAFERSVVNAFKAIGFHALRTAPMQAGHPQHAADVEVYREAGGLLMYAVECKAWGPMPSTAVVRRAMEQALECVNLPLTTTALVVYKTNARRGRRVCWRRGALLVEADFDEWLAQL